MDKNPVVVGTTVQSRDGATLKIEKLVLSEHGNDLLRARPNTKTPVGATVPTGLATPAAEDSSKPIAPGVRIPRRRF